MSFVWVLIQNVSIMLYLELPIITDMRSWVNIAVFFFWLTSLASYPVFETKRSCWNDLFIDIFVDMHPGYPAISPVKNLNPNGL